MSMSSKCTANYNNFNIIQDCEFGALNIDKLCIKILKICKNIYNIFLNMQKKI